jgi:hypothetical protein
MIFINILIILKLSQGTINQNDFKVFKNQEINFTVGESSLISNVFKPSRMQCMAGCSLNENCKTAVYYNCQGRLINCFIYTRFFQTIEFIPTSTGVVYQKKSNSYLGNIHSKKGIYKVSVKLLEFG